MRQTDCSDPSCDFQGENDKQWIVPNDDLAYSLSVKVPEASDLVAFCSFECANILNQHR